jgi:hypothetical protein
MSNGSRGGSAVKATVLAAPFGIAVLSPVTGVCLGALEASLALAVVLTYPFGNSTHSRRAFRLVQWAFNRAEPA